MNKVQKKSFFCYKNWPWTHFLTVWCRLSATMAKMVKFNKTAWLYTTVRHISFIYKAQINNKSWPLCCTKKPHRNKKQYI